VDLRLRIDQTGAISNKSYLVFTARAKWCQRDRFDPIMYNVGFQLVGMSPEDYKIFVKMFHTYGTKVTEKQDNDNIDYSSARLSSIIPEFPSEGGIPFIEPGCWNGSIRIKFGWRIK